MNRARGESLYTNVATLAAVSGGPARTDTGQLALEATLLPTLFSPSIAPLPFQIPEESRMQQRHLDLLLNRPARDILVLRQFIIAQLRKHLESTLSCLEVQTPILAANAGGATARPFSTHTADSEKQLALRIAPELWLKRLVVAGFDRVFELGQAFRNEGVDATHNPEFTVCEFYMAHANLDGLMNITQNMFYALAKAVDLHVKKAKMELQTPEPSTFEGAFEKVEFLPELEKALGQVLPDLNRPTAVLDIIKLLDNAGKDWHHSLPPNPSLPKLLDHLAGVVLEPRSLGRPLYIIHHPVCMSPLAKTFTCPKTGQQVAARAELFFDGKELANMYEEENDPFKQRRKLVSQAQTRLAQQGAEALADDDEPPHVIDEQYISVLESGLPPTAGWGCGVDRLVMLFTGAKRISDVLPFGNLRNVIGLASASLQPTSQQSQEDKAAANVGANIEESEKNVPSEVVMKKDIGIQIPKPSDFEALTAVSFLGIPMKGFPEANAEASTGEAMPAIRHATKTIEDETPYMDPVTAELMSSVEAGMKLGAQNAREPLDVDTDRRPSQGSFARRHVPSIIEDDTPLTDPIADHIFSIKARMEIGGQGEQETPGPNTDGKPSQITSAERRVEEALVMDSRVEETASAAAEVDKNTPGAVETAGPNTDGGPSRVTSVKRRVTQFIEDD